MFAASRQPSASRSTDDQSTKEKKHPRRYAHDLSISSHSLATPGPVNDDLHVPPISTLHTTSAHSTPMTSPSTAYSSLFPGSLSSATSESAPYADSKHRSEFGVLTPGSHSPILGSSSSHSSIPTSPRSNTMTEPDTQASAPHRYPTGRSSPRSSSAPQSPSLPPAASSADHSQPDRHTRTHSRFAMGLKHLLSKPTIPSPSRFSLTSAKTMPLESGTSSSSFLTPTASAKRPMTPQKSLPPDLEISPIPSQSHHSLTDVHRRYASEATAKVYHSRADGGLPTSQESLEVSPPHVPQPPPRGREPKTRNVLRRRPSGSAKLFRPRERGTSSPSRPSEADLDPLPLPPKERASRQGRLTPASAVVEAYKQQELFRDDVPPKRSIDQVSSTESHEGFGSRSDRWRSFEADHCTPSLPHQPSMSDSLGRHLTRKVSSRWRKLKGAGVVPEESPSHGRGHSKGRPSLQEMWKGDMRLTGQSMDGLLNTGNGTWASPMAAHARSVSDKTEGAEGNKLWRMMRRISTGGLRDRFQAEMVVPPVPAIPKELLEKPSLGVLTPQRASLQAKDHARPSRNITYPQPRAAATSPSPNSSDVASMQFFHQAHSARSSISSYGEAVRVPDIILHRHIIAPIEQLRLADDQDESCIPVPKSPRRSTSVPAGLRTAEDGIPRSPRRQTSPGDPPSATSSRPSSTSVSASESPRASQQLLGRSRMADGIVSLSPPPRPPRHSRRGEGSLGSPLSLVRPGARQMDRMPSAQSDMTARPLKQPTYRELDAPRRPPLSEREKADIWDALLARSEQAGGTLHIHGATELMSDSMRFSMVSESP